MLTITITASQATFEVRVKSVDQDAFYLVINDLKQRVPSHLRTYNLAFRSWFIKRQAAHYLCEWIEQARDAFDASVEGDPGPWTRGCRPDWQSTYEYDDGESYSPPRPKSIDPYQTLHLLPSAPPEVVRAAYKALAMKHHPDHGGDVGAMQRINDAYRRLAA